MNRFALLFAAGLFALCGCGPEDGGSEVAEASKSIAARDYRSALNAYREACTVCPTNLTALVGAASTSITLGEPNDALAYSTKALQVDAASAEARLVDGQASFLLNDYSRADEDFRIVQDAAGLPLQTRSQAYASRSVLQMIANERDAARLSLLRALRLDSRNGAARYHLGYLYRDMGYDAAAMDQFVVAASCPGMDFEKVRKIRERIIPDLQEALRNEILRNDRNGNRNPEAAAKALAEAEKATQRKSGDAIVLKKYKEAYDADPMNFAAAVSYAKCLASSRGADPTKTLEAFKAASRIRPSSQDVYQSAGRFALRTGNYMTACDMLSRGLAFAPENKETLDLYIQALQKSGKREEVKLYQAYQKELK